MRAALARLLYQKPDLLLLDEPTNHLDMPSVRWLETFLQGFKGAMILVSHDREFLNRQIHRLVSFETEGMRSYSGNYDFYVKARAEEVKSLENKARNQEQKIKDAQKFIERFRSKANKARQAQSKIKLVEKMELIQTHRKEKTIRFSFPAIARSGDEVVAIRDVSKWFGDNILYEHLNARVTRGEKNRDHRRQRLWKDHAASRRGRGIEAGPGANRGGTPGRYRLFCAAPFRTCSILRRPWWRRSTNPYPMRPSGL